jgi:hypothetical protein
VSLVSFVLKWCPFVARRRSVSTHLYHGQRLSRDHLLEIAAHGFEMRCATRRTLTYHNWWPAEFQQWMVSWSIFTHSRSGHARVRRGPLDRAI